MPCTPPWRNSTAGPPARCANPASEADWRSCLLAGLADQIFCQAPLFFLKNAGYAPRLLWRWCARHSLGGIVDFARLQARQAVTSLSKVLLPPRLTGITWSQVSGPVRIP